jgi:hypothetical protein
VERRIPQRGGPKDFRELIDLIAIRLKPGFRWNHPGSAAMTLAEEPDVVFLPAYGNPGKQELVQILRTNFAQWGR